MLQVYFYVDLVEVINARSGSLDNANAWQVCEKFDKNPITGFDSIERMIPSMAQRTSLLFYKVWLHYLLREIKEEEEL